MSVVALIDYGAGNLRSVHNALVAAGADNVAVTADPEVVGQADRIVLPGVGAFPACMNGLSAIAGLIDAMAQRVREPGAPFIGIYIVMHLLAAEGAEPDRHPVLGWNADPASRRDSCSEGVLQCGSAPVGHAPTK